MPDFPFIYVCDLLDDLERLADPKSRLVIPRDLARLTTERFIAWSKAHCARLNACYLEDDAVGRTLRPEGSTDRVNGLDGERLEHVIARVLMLSAAQVVELRKWREGSAYGDLGACVAAVVQDMSTAIPVRGLTNLVTVQEIDQGLLQLSAFNPQSSPAVCSLAQHIPRLDQLGIVENLYLRMQAREAKWLTRLILKSYAPIKIPESPEIAASHSGLPNMLCLKAEVRRPKPVPMLRHAYSGWIRGADPAETPSIDVLTPPTTPPEQTITAAKCLMRETGRPKSADDNIPPSSSSAHSSSALTSTATPSTTLASRPKSLASPESRQVLPLATPGQHSSRKRPLNGLPPPLAPHEFVASNSASSPNNTETSTPSSTSACLIQGGNAKCSLTSESQNCPFTNCIIVFAPHLSSNARLREYLLPLHGCRYTTSALALKSSFVVPNFPQASKKIKKLALVDSRKTEEAVEFMKVIRALDLRKRIEDGSVKRDWVEVYDWRLLEMVARAEKGERNGREAGLPWRRCWIGAI